MSQHLHLSERRRIAALLAHGKKVREIARILGRGKSAVAEEIRKGGGTEAYDPAKADHRAHLARRNAKQQCLKVALDPALKRFVSDHMRDDQSPEGISGRLKHREQSLPYASPKAIRNFLASVHGRELERHLWSQAVKKKSGPKTRRPVAIDGRTMIDQRPRSVEKRLQFGHFEGDFIESGRDGTGSVLVLVERKTRYPFLAYIEDRSTAAVNAAIARLLSGMPVRSVTLDNDISFQKHPELSELIDAAIFFCHPSSPQEKGTVENRNKALRRYLPKRSDLSVRKALLPEIERKLRDRFMACLRYWTPEEAVAAEMKKAALKAGGMLERVLKASAKCPV